MPHAQTESPEPDWTPVQSERLYGLREWGLGYFVIFMLDRKRLLLVSASVSGTTPSIT